MTILVTGAPAMSAATSSNNSSSAAPTCARWSAIPRRPTSRRASTVVQGDLLDVDSLRSAFSGVSTLFLLNGVVADEFTQALDRAQPCPRGRYRADRLPLGDPQRRLRERAALRGQVRRRAHDRADGLQRHHPAPGLLHEQRHHDQGRGDRLRHLPDADRQQGPRHDRRARRRRDRGDRAHPPRAVRHAASARTASTWSVPTR